MGKIFIYFQSTLIDVNVSGCAYKKLISSDKKYCYYISDPIHIQYF